MWKWPTVPAVRHASVGEPATMKGLQLTDRVDVARVGQKHAPVFGAEVLQVQVRAIVLLWEEVFGEEVDGRALEACSEDDDIRFKLFFVFIALSRRVTLVLLQHETKQSNTVHHHQQRTERTLCSGEGERSVRSSVDGLEDDAAALGTCGGLTLTRTPLSVSVLPSPRM